MAVSLPLSRLITLTSPPSDRGATQFSDSPRIRTWTSYHLPVSRRLVSAARYSDDGLSRFECESWTMIVTVTDLPYVIHGP
ncbi:hypothetical protein EVAR_20370_1 [Eumeta japonica]|uniref:Uncharacterized protein n=1 Tax=Eumeta variegata TaxID=151549 RepID=A0A4C1VT70_EUMVA|nr:hypothetical protein EVAR_20370_1 [Eumeta japonica]